MASEKITFINLFKTVFKTKTSFRNYLFFVMTLLALGFVSVYLNYTELYFIGFVLLFFVLVPLFVAYIEYSALIESGARTERKIRSIYDLYRNTFRSGRLKVVYSFKTILILFLYLLIVGIIFILGFSFYLSLFQPELMSNLQTIFDMMVLAETLEELTPLFESVATLLDPFLLSLNVFMQIMLMVGIIFIFINVAFKINTQMFIEHKPTTPYETLEQHFYSDPSSKKTKRKVLYSLAIVVSLLYGVIYASTFFISKAINPNGMFYLQAELVGVFVLILLLPLVVRYLYFAYHAIIKPKRIEVLAFSIVELKGLISTPGIPEVTKNYLISLLKMREEEYSLLVNPPENSEKEDKSAN